MATNKIQPAETADPIRAWKEIMRRGSRRRRDFVTRAMQAMRNEIRKRNHGIVADSTSLVREDRDGR